MNYELAKKLKDAGFPQNWDKVINFYDEERVLWSVGDCESFSKWEANPDGSGYHTPSTPGCGCCGGSVGSSVNNFVYAPTLSELIEACGDELLEIRHNPEYKSWGAGNKLEWDNPLAIIGIGKTPEESVANLWLKLNNK